MLVRSTYILNRNVENNETNTLVPVHFALSLKDFGLKLKCAVCLFWKLTLGIGSEYSGILRKYVIADGK
jgi:hypothetical protein